MITNLYIIFLISGSRRKSLRTLTNCMNSVLVFQRVNLVIFTSLLHTFSKFENGFAVFPVIWDRKINIVVNVELTIQIWHSLLAAITYYSTVIHWDERVVSHGFWIKSDFGVTNRWHGEQKYHARVLTTPANNIFHSVYLESDLENLHIGVLITFSYNLHLDSIPKMLHVYYVHRIVVFVHWVE